MKKQRCSPNCPPRRPDGSISESLMSLCLLCFNTGFRIPIGGRYTIDQWVRMHTPQAPTP